jgi:hypothetical protein
MDLLVLVAALWLPWAVGALLLRYAATRGARPNINAPLLLGYGLFIGYQLLYLLLRASSAVLGQVSVRAVVAALVLLGGALLALTRRQSRAALAAGSAEDGAAARTATVALAFLATLHLAYCAVEVLHLPLFPWDAWASWLYRAKIWFLAGDFVTIASPREWRADASLTYSVIASEYPGFLPAIAMWSALAFGRWSETLVNLPTLACGAALGLALYGQCRSWGLPRWTGTLGAYLLLSLPLIGTHLSLGGYADIWMAGYAGLGLLALLVGTVREDRQQLLLGFLLLALGMAVKREGGIWLLVGAGMVALAVLPWRWLLTAVAALAVVAGALTMLGLGTIPVPGLGRLFRWLLFPLGSPYAPPSDQTGKAIAQLLQSENESRDRLVEGVYFSDQDDASGRVHSAFHLVLTATKAESAIRNALNTPVTFENHLELVRKAVESGVITEEQATTVRLAQEAARAVIEVDEFSLAEIEGAHRHASASAACAGLRPQTTVVAAPPPIPRKSMISRRCCSPSSYPIWISSRQ